MNLDELFDLAENNCDNFNSRESEIMYIEKILHKAGYETEKQNDGLIWKTDKDESVFIPVDENGGIKDFKYFGHKDVEIQINSTDDKLKDHIDYNNKVLEAANIKSSVGATDFHDFIHIPSTNAIGESLNICFDQNGNIIYIVTDSKLEEDEEHYVNEYYEECDYWRDKELFSMERENEEYWNY